jgi:hypothetical protein
MSCTKHLQYELQAAFTQQCVWCELERVRVDLATAHEEIERWRERHGLVAETVCERERTIIAMRDSAIAGQEAAVQWGFYAGGVAAHAQSSGSGIPQMLSGNLTADRAVSDWKAEQAARYRQRATEGKEPR